MQSIFRLPWAMDQVAPKMQSNKASANKMRTPPVLDMASLSKLKRKRSESPEPYSNGWMQPVKKSRHEVCRHSPHMATQLLPKLEPKKEATIATHNPPNSVQRFEDSMSHANIGQHSQSYRDASSQAAPHLVQQSFARHPDDQTKTADSQSLAQSTGANMTPLKQTIANEFNMQILMKHNELRLIEQELSKCQIALEQLRRCELRPYPGTQQLSVAVSEGTGPSVAPPAGFTQPTHAAPYGVTDGPYGAHYRQWLLPDPQFEPAPLHVTPVINTTPSGDARHTRHASTARKSIQKSFTMPSITSDTQRSLPNYPPSNRRNKIAIVRRSTDGQLVKLVCNHCHRSDFSNSQGFLNHCRIAHKLEYKSHDQAAVDCGHLLDEIELANVPPEALAAPAPKPSGHRSSSITTTPLKMHNYVHPLNAPGGFAARNSIPASKDSGRIPKRAVPASSLVPLRSTGLPLTASSQAPRLSAQFAKYKIGGNLEEAIAKAKQKVDLSSEEVLSPDTPDSASPLQPVAQGARTVMGTSRASSLAPPGGVARPPSRKGYRQPVSRPRPSPLTQTSRGMETDMRILEPSSSDSPMSPPDSSMHLSPHTVESNPGLVSDHEDDDHGSASEDEIPQAAIAHSLGLARRSCTDGMDIDVSVDDDIDEHGVIIRRNSMLAADDRAGASSRKMGGSGTGV